LASQLGRAGRARAERLTWSGVLDRLTDDYFALLPQGMLRQAA
jgi:hypothetical protein